jgi:hypothetical protein
MHVSEQSASISSGSSQIYNGHTVLEVALWATTWVFFAGVIFGVLLPQLSTLLGGGPTADPGAQAAANARSSLSRPY